MLIPRFLEAAARDAELKPHRPDVRLVTFIP
ncbi:MAG: hypothetical protein K0Q72_2819, partial [Armatimonadetes bacterium]|nr:hypothetical protein [Armatimonadota bacterium]